MCLTTDEELNNLTEMDQVKYLKEGNTDLRLN